MYEQWYGYLILYFHLLSFNTFTSKQVVQIHSSYTFFSFCLALSFSNEEIFYVIQY